MDYGLVQIVIIPLTDDQMCMSILNQNIRTLQDLFVPFVTNFVQLEMP